MKQLKTKIEKEKKKHEKLKVKYAVLHTCQSTSAENMSHTNTRGDRVSQ